MIIYLESLADAKHPLLGSLFHRGRSRLNQLAHHIVFVDGRKP